MIIPMDFSHYNMMMETSRALPSICLQNLRATGSCCARFSGFHWCKRSVWRPETAGFRSLKKNILGQGTPTLRSSIQTTPHYPSNSGVKMVSHGMPNGVQKKKKHRLRTIGNWEMELFPSRRHHSAPSASPSSSQVLATASIGHMHLAMGAAWSNGFVSSAPKRQSLQQ